MKKYIFASVLFLLSSVAYGQTQLEMNMEASAKCEKADSELNKVYQKILQVYKTDVVFVKSAREAQRQWLKYRDAQLKMKFPPYQDAIGSVLPMCIASYKEELTKIRIEERKQWLNGALEGDACSGSLKSMP